MQFRVVKVKAKNGFRQYGQIVESFRRPADGMPTHRVIASLGVVSDEQAAVFKAAFSAAGRGAGIAVLEGNALADLAPAPEWTRDWLDIAACWQAWHDSGLHDLVRGLFAGHQEEVEPADVVAALVVQRCVAPASKLAACEWFADTALPELLGIAPARFHNTRLHRVLERLEKADADLQCAFADLLRNAGGQPCTALYIDCTDTWFTGHGPALAERGKTKEEFYREKIGILLLCRQDGMPLRFKVLRGNTEDGKAMLQQMAELADAAWFGAVPLVADRALGNTADLLEMSALGLQFVTALVASEHAAYGAVFNCPALHDLDPNQPQCLVQAGATAVAAGMTRHAADLYVLEHAVVQRDAADRATANEVLGDAAVRHYRRGDDMARDMLQQARRYKASVQGGHFASQCALQRGIGRSNGHMSRIMGMLKLPADVQAAIDGGAAANLGKRDIEVLCKGRDEAVHRQRFTELCATTGPKLRHDRKPSSPANTSRQPWVQIAVAFNPVMWRAKRQRALQRHDKLLAKVERINQRLNAATKPARLATAKLQVLELLRKIKGTQLYAIEEVELKTGVTTLCLVRNEMKWREKRSRDGLQVIAAAPELDLSAADRVRLYRSKDKIEKNFCEIKGVLELRPVWHRTDAKVRAHVTLCVLALAVQRWLGQRLAKAGRSETAARAVDELRNVRLVGLRLPRATALIAQPNATTPARQELAAALGVDWALQVGTTAPRLKNVR